MGEGGWFRVGDDILSNSSSITLKFLLQCSISSSHSLGLSDYEGHEESLTPTTPMKSGDVETGKRLRFDLETFRAENVDDSLPRQRFMVSREEGMEELKQDILGCYKNPNCQLKAKLFVRFEGEEGVGSGPLREFLLCAMKIPQEGIGKEGKPVIFFEGEDDHKVPVHNQALRCTGAFRAIGRMIGHSILHGGPFLYGLSTAAKLYWATMRSDKIGDNDLATQALPLILEDIPDLALRQHISEVIKSV